MAGLTKQHFNKIEEVIKKHFEVVENDINDKTLFNTSMDFIDELSDYFKTQNPLFNKNQFKKACLK